MSFIVHRDVVVARGVEEAGLGLFSLFISGFEVRPRVIDFRVEATEALCRTGRRGGETVRLRGLGVFDREKD